MLNWFKRKVIGGDTGATEGAWFLVLCWMIAAGVMFWFSMNGYDTGRSVDLLENMGYAVLTVWTAAHGVKNVGQSFGTNPAPKIDEWDGRE